MTRELYSPAGIAAMKKKLANTAIEMFVEDDAHARARPIVKPCFEGNAEWGFRFSTQHEPIQHELDDIPPDDPRMYHFRYPPVDRSYAGFRSIVEDEHGRMLPGPGKDVWAEVYAPFVDGLDSAFDGWEALPDERDFYRAADALEQAIAPLAIGPAAGTAGNDDLAHALAQLNGAMLDPFGRMEGYTIQLFRNAYVRPLETLLVQQYWMCRVLAGLLRAEGDTWHRTRMSVMQVGELAIDELGYHPERSLKELVTALGGLANFLSLLPIPTVSKAGDVLGLFVDAIELYWMANQPPEPRRTIEAALYGATPETIVEKVRGALAELNRQVVEEELALQGTADAVVDASYTPSRLVTPSGRYEVSVNLPAPELLLDTDPTRIADGIRVSLDQMRKAAAVTPTLAEHLERTASQLPSGDPGDSAWQRPGFIGFGATGPSKNWNEMLQRAGAVIADTAGELRAAGEHLALAADALERSDDESRAALERHSREVASVAAPDPGPPAPPEPPRRTGPGHPLE